MMNAKIEPPKGQKKKSRTWLRIAVLCVLLLASGVLVLRQTAQPLQTETMPQPTTEAALQAQETPPPESGRTARELAYDKDVQTLTELTKNEQTDAQTREQAAKRLSQMVLEHQTELGIEEALTQAGFRPCLVLMQNGALTVMIAATELTGAQSVTILSICAAHSDIGVENIRIMTGAIK